MNYIYPSLAYGLYSISDINLVKERKTLKIRDIYTLNNIIKILFRKRDTEVVLKNIYRFSYNILNDENIIKEIIKKKIKKLRNKKIKLSKFMEVKFSDFMNNNYKIILSSEKFPIIYLDKNLLPNLVYIVHNLHIKILTKVLEAIIKNYTEIKIPYDINLDYSILGFKVGLEPIFAISLYYNAKYIKKEDFYIKYIDFVNDLAIRVNKNIIDIVEDKKVNEDTLIEFSKDLKKLRNEGIL
ncbi:hypothetical protein YN1_1460 [Nanoarchaeota archaeon]